MWVSSTLETSVPDERACPVGSLLVLATYSALYSRDLLADALEGIGTVDPVGWAS